ncbi:MAG: hypothetical protein JNK89_11240 [Saprospiraceae bacterium]|nr:hypothetical protein [Saprospiraceae bacterium]
MEKGYLKLAYFFAAIALLTFIGFYKRYFALFPQFEGLSAIHHAHALALMTWLGILIAQPVLIARKKLALHRAIGKFSYFLVPVMFVSMLLAYYAQYLRMIAEGKPESETLAFVFSPTTDAIPFVIFYLLAVWNKHDTARHMRYMIGTAVVIGGPGLARIFISWMHMEFFAALALLSLVTLLVFIALIVYDRVQKKQFRLNPYTICLLIWLVPNILITFFPNTALWQDFARGLVRGVG